MIDTAVEISQILLPVILAAVGWLVARSQVKFASALKQRVDFEEGWNANVQRACLSYSDSFSDLLSLLFSHDIASEIEKVKELTDRVRRDEYVLRVKASSLEGADGIVRLSQNMLSELSNLMANRGGDTDGLIKLHSKFIAEVRRFFASTKAA